MVLICVSNDASAAPDAPHRRNHERIQQYICEGRSHIQVFEIILFAIGDDPCISGDPQIGKG